MNSNYINKYNNIFQQIGDHAKIVLATSHQDKVTARKMSFLIMNEIGRASCRERVSLHV